MDALIQRAKTKDVKEVFINGRTMLTDEIFMMVDEEKILSKIHEALNAPIDGDEVDRRYFRKKFSIC